MPGGFRMAMLTELNGGAQVDDDPQLYFAWAE